MKLLNIVKVNNQGMELVQVAILVAIAIALGLIFRTEITGFVNKTFESLNGEF
ncbi:MAG: Flp1 family type IVb pilin [Anaerovoracaceae bacterium]